jgi:hypothetical protein
LQLAFSAASKIKTVNSEFQTACKTTPATIWHPEWFKSKFFEFIFWGRKITRGKTMAALGRIPEELKQARDFALHGNYDTALVYYDGERGRREKMGVVVHVHLRE